MLLPTEGLSQVECSVLKNKFTKWVMYFLWICAPV